MDYAGPGCGILSLVVTERYIWCLDFKGGLYLSILPNGSLHWQRFEDNVQQVAVSPSGGENRNIQGGVVEAYPPVVKCGDILP